MSIKDQVNRVGNLERQLGNIKEHLGQILSHLRGSRPEVASKDQESPHSILEQFDRSLIHAQKNANDINEYVAELADIIGIYDDKKSMPSTLSGLAGSSIKSDRY